MDLRYVLIGVLWFAMMIGPARAQNAPVSGLAPRTPPVQATDLIPILPAGAARLQSATVAQLQSAIGGGTVTSVTCGAGLNGGTITTTGACSLADIAAQTHKFIAAITSGVATLTQPAFGDLSGSATCAQLPALTGEATTAAGSCATTIATNAVTNAKAAQMAANTVKGNFTAGAANATDNAMPSCADSGGQHLNYVSGTGLTCGTNSQQALPPYLLKFGPATQIPYFDPQPAGLINVTDNFASTGTFTNISVGGSASFSVSSSTGTVAGSGANWQQFYQETSDAIAAPEWFSSITVSGKPSSGSGYDHVMVGVCKSSTVAAFAIYDTVGHTLYSYAFGGLGSVTSSSISVTLTAPYQIALSAISNTVSTWYKTGNYWIYGNSSAIGAGAYNFTASGAMSGVKTCFGEAAGTSSTSNFQAQRGGRFGGIGLRDIKPVINPDGTTYQPGGNLIYFTATVAGPTGMSYEGVFTLNLNTLAITQTGVILDTRSSVTHVDDAGQVIYHSNGDRELLLSGWDTFPASPVKVQYAYLASGSQGDLLTSNLSVVAMTQLTLPGDTNGAYDPALVYATTSQCPSTPTPCWFLAYTILTNATGSLAAPATSFYPALAYATSSPAGIWMSIASDSSLLGDWEGCSITNASGSDYVLCGGPGFPVPNSGLVGGNSSRVYDMTLTYLGPLKGATLNGAGGSQENGTNPHPTLFQHPDGQHQVLFTFDGTRFPANGGGTGAIYSWGQPMIEISTP
ncbi:MAG TPA: hypothetical protein VG166_09150 [Caulobacteraceae bacterium]|jgi:hypothetical protein|nr:hypothetical protein [Caulobacteraceae bacterium]